MKAKLQFTTAAISLFICLVKPAQGQGLLAYHSGYNNPTSEGWTSQTDFGSPQTGAVTNDLGVSAWSMLLYGSGGGYSKNLNYFMGRDWVLSLNVRLVTPGQSGAFPFVANINTGSTAFLMMYSSDASGNPIVQVRGATPSPVIMLAGGSVYNNYQLNYSAAANQASLWVNGAELYSGIKGYPSSTAPLVEWGGANQRLLSFQANWNQVSLQIVPEPCSLSLLGGGLLLLAARRRRHHQNQTRSHHLSAPH